MKTTILSILPVFIVMVLTTVICMTINFEHVQGIEMYFWVFCMVLIPVVLVYVLVLCTKFGEKYL